ncbi:MAG: hypothetical protein J6B11_03995, partial [Spirochaetales bacterium]|nr:hypothetical protein [Spirochaetales bacterium]
PIGNTPFVHIVYSSTTHVNGYSFRLDISCGNISFVLRTHRVCKENHSCSRLLQIKNRHAEFISASASVTSPE